MKSILLDAHDDSGLATRVAATNVLARSLAADVTCVQTIARPAMLATGLMGPSIQQAEIARRTAPAVTRSECQRELVCAMFDPACTTHWRCEVAGRGEALLMASHLSDLMVISLADVDEPATLWSDVLRHCACPILGVPVLLPRFDPAAPALVAWDGSAAASVAVRNALPLLRLAAAVHVVTIGAEPTLRVREVIDYLATNDVVARGELRPETGPIAAELLAAAQEHKAALIILGATGHTALGEFIFGSVACRR
jgi:nucleotide-binding universal stress UspA family protein